MENRVKFEKSKFEGATGLDALRVECVIGQALHMDADVGFSVDEEI